MNPIINNAITTKQALWICLLLALLIRLALMPFFLHMDLLSEMRRIHYASENAVYYPSFTRISIFYVERFFYFFTKPFMVSPDTLFYLSVPYASATTTDHFVFTGDASVFRHLFLFKLPYLVFDGLCAWLIWLFFKGQPYRLAILCLWLFNPVTLYATYIFGRFEVISLFFVILSAYGLQQKRLILASFAFVLALHAREINTLFLPAFFFALWVWARQNRSWRTPILSAMIVLVAWRIPGFMEHWFGLQSVFIQESNLVEIPWLKKSIFVNQDGLILPFIAVSSFAALWMIQQHIRDSDRAFVTGATALILPFFLAGLYSAHYYTWAIAPALLSLRYVPRAWFAVVVMSFAWLAYWCFDSSGAHFTGLLLTPLDASFFGRPTIGQLYNQTIGLAQVVSAANMRQVFFSILVAAQAVLFWKLLNAKHGDTLAKSSETLR